MHIAQQYLNTVYPNSQAISVPLTNVQVSILEKNLIQDSVAYTYSGIVSLADAISGLDRGAYSWPTVKAYYSSFYFLRAILAINKICIFYIGTRPYNIKSSAGELPVKVGANTHQTVLSLFKTHAKNHWLLSQDIDGLNPLDWIRELREEANYKKSRFIEPAVPKQFSLIKKLGVRRSVANYISDTTLAFDKDHAILAYPIRAMVFAVSDIRAAGQYFSEVDTQFLSSLCRDKSGAITAFNSVIKPQS